MASTGKEQIGVKLACDPGVKTEAHVFHVNKELPYLIAKCINKWLHANAMRTTSVTITTVLIP